VAAWQLPPIEMAVGWSQPPVQMVVGFFVFSCFFHLVIPEIINAK
jgi:hypothetical protein